MMEDKHIGTVVGTKKVVSFSHFRTLKDRKIKYYNCVCECGNQICVTIQNAGAYRGCSKCRLLHCVKTVEDKYVGNKYGRLVVLELHEKKTYPSGCVKNSWVCKCDCGNITKGVTTSALTTGGTISCGCAQREVSAGNSIKSRHKIAKKEAPYNVVFNRYKSGAEKRGLPFELTKDEFKVIIGMNCFYCDSGLSNTHDKNYYNLDYNGIDRLDNNDGYTVNNTVACCYTCNRAKNTSSLDEFLSWALRLGRTAMRIKISEMGVKEGLPAFGWINDNQNHLLKKLIELKQELSESKDL